MCINKNGGRSCPRHSSSNGALAAQYGLPLSQLVTQTGNGEIFVKRQYDTVLTIAVTIFLLVIFPFQMEKRRHRLGTEQVATPKQIKNDADLTL
jgi:hypothetical protein